MANYVSAEGLQSLKELRVGAFDLPVSTGPAPIELLARVPSDECGCPEEIWRVDGAIYLIHMEDDDGTGEIFYFGEDQYEWRVQVDTIDQLRAEMFRVHAETPIGAD